MSQSVFYVQSCPTCGRQLEVRVDYLGKIVVCEHCGARFTAQEGISPDPLEDSVLGALAKADQFLKESSRRAPK